MCIIVVGKQMLTSILFLAPNYIKHMIKLGSNVKSKIHDDLTGSVVLLERSNNYAVVSTHIDDYEIMTVECFLSDLEVA